MNNVELHKVRISTRYWLQAKAEHDERYYKVLQAILIMEQYHTGMRKDGVTPTMIHQYSIFGYIKTLHKLIRDPVSAFIVAFLHDTYEDYPESIDLISREFPDQLDMIVKISKFRNNQPIPYNVYFSDMTNCPVCSLVKAIDRIHNVSTMVGVFSVAKQDQYLHEVDVYFLRMIKTARRLFPDQELAYENIKSMLIIQRDTIRLMR